MSRGTRALTYSDRRMIYAILTRISGLRGRSTRPFEIKILNFPNGRE